MKVTKPTEAYIKFDEYDNEVLEKINILFENLMEEMETNRYDEIDNGTTSLYYSEIEECYNILQELFHLTIENEGEAVIK